MSPDVSMYSTPSREHSTHKQSSGWAERFGNDVKNRADHKIQSLQAGRGAWAMLFVLEALIPLRWHEAKMRGLRLGSKGAKGGKAGCDHIIWHRNRDMNPQRLCRWLSYAKSQSC